MLYFIPERLLEVLVSSLSHTKWVFVTYNVRELKLATLRKRQRSQQMPLITECSL